MSGRLVLGPMAPQLFEAFRAEIGRWIESDPLAPGVVLVGSNLLGLALRRRLALAGTPHAGLRFLTFADLGRTLAAPRLAGRSALPPGGRVLAARSLARERRAARAAGTGAGANAGASEARGFDRVAERPGFHRCLAKTFGDLDDGALAETIASLAARADAGGAKVGEVLALYAEYRRLVDPAFFTTSDLIRLGAHEAHAFRERFGSARLALYGFYDFTEVQRRLLAALARQGVERFVAFAPDPNAPGYAFAAEAIGFLGGLGLARETIAAPPATTPPLRPDVISAPSEVEEAREIVRTILRLARDGGIAFNEMGILLRSPQTYARPLHEALLEAGVPFYLHHGLSIATTPAGRGARLLLDLARSPHRRADVIEFLTAAPLAPERAPAADISPSLWDLVTRRAGIVEGRAAWTEGLRAFLRSSAPARERRAASSLLSTVTRLFEDLASLPGGRGSWGSFADATRRLLRTWIAPSEGRDAIDACIASLAANDRLAGPTSLEEFQETLEDEMEGITQTVGAFGVEGVTVSDLARARGLGFRVVFIPGLVERGFPAPPAQDPILLDGERERLSRTGGGSLAQGLARAREEDLRFALACAAAEERLIFSYPRFETGTSRERTASPFLVKAIEAHEGRPITIRTLAEVPGVRRVPLFGKGPRASNEALSAPERRLAAALSNDRSDRLAVERALAAERPGFARSLRAWEARWEERGVLNAFTGLLSARALRRLLAARPLLGETLSASAMETYATCPYRYFLKEAIRLEEIPEPEKIEEIDGGDRGRLVHRILERLFAALAHDGFLPLDADRLEAANAALSEIAREEFADAESRGETGFPLIWEIVCERILTTLANFLRFEAQGGFGAAAAVPVLEAQFGRGGHDEAAVRLPSGRLLKFRGAIDRLDLAEGGGRFLVLDYKAHWEKAPPVSRTADPIFQGGETLQLPVYLLAGPARIGDARPAATARARDRGAAIAPERGDARYVRFLLKSGRMKLSPPLTTEILASRRADLDTMLETIASGLEAGFFPVFPRGGENCRFCDYARVCGPAPSVSRLYESKATDERFARFHAMKAIGARSSAKGGPAEDAEDDDA